MPEHPFNRQDHSHRRQRQGTQKMRSHQKCGEAKERPNQDSKSSVGFAQIPDKRHSDLPARAFFC